MIPSARADGSLYLSVLLWLVVVAAGLALRPPLPINETRYLSVAWEMWSGGDFLVPHLNGAPYSDKPPILFWLIHLGWSLFGVSEWWGRLVAPLFGLGSLFAIAHLARLLWPADTETGPLAALVLIGGAPFAIYSSVTMFDVPMAFFTLIALIGVARAWRRGGTVGWIACGLALGLGGLVKGPVVLLYVLPVPLLAPLWGREIGTGAGWARWYAGLGLAVVVGLAVAAAWIVPAVRGGGDAFANAILWHQTTDRMLQSADHARPLWWYLPLLPLFFYPWAFYAPLWTALRRGIRAGVGGGARFCLLWFVLPLAGLSLISGKQPHYLLPLMPAFALLVARFFAADPHRGPRRLTLVVPALLPIVAGVALLLLSLPAVVDGVLAGRGPPWLGHLAPAGGLALLAAGVAMIALSLGAERARATALAALTAFTVVIVDYEFDAAPRRYYDLREVAAYLGRMEREGRPLAHGHNYQGEYHFLGRLTRPLALLHDNRVLDWAKQNPEGRYIAHLKSSPADSRPAPEFYQPYRGKWIAVWRAADVVAREGDVLGNDLGNIPARQDVLAGIE